MSDTIEDTRDAWKALGFHWTHAKMLSESGIAPEDVQALVSKHDTFDAGIFLSLGVNETVADKLLSHFGGKVEETTNESPDEKEEAPAPSGDSEIKAKPVQQTAATTHATIAQLLKKFGNKYGENSVVLASSLGTGKRLATRYPSLNAITEGGFPVGKFTVIAGPEQTCKSTICLDTIAYQQSLNPDAIWIWIDAENSFDTGWAEHLGVDLSRLIIIPPGVMEDQLNAAMQMLGEAEIQGVVLDSVGGLLPAAEVKKDKKDKEWTRTMHDDQVGVLQRQMSKFFRVSNVRSSSTGTAWIVLTHVYQNIGNPYQEWAIKGGSAQAHWASLRLITSRRKGDQDAKIDLLMPDGKKKNVYVAYEAVFTIDKIRGKSQNHAVSIPFVYGEGLSEKQSVIDSALALGIIESKPGGYYIFDGQTMRGKDAFVAALTADEEAYSKVLAAVGMAAWEQHQS